MDSLLKASENFEQVNNEFDEKVFIEFNEANYGMAVSWFKQGQISCFARTRKES